MKGVILAAGVSSRLRPLTDHIPKCLLEPGGRPILGMALESLIANGIGDVVLVTGYREDRIRAYVHDAYPALDVKFVTNTRFEDTNNSYSLWLTERAVGDEGVVLLDSDIVFDRRIISLLARSGHDNALALSRGTTLGEEEIKVQVSPDGWVSRIGKDVPPGDAAGESIGIEFLSPGFLRSLYRILGRMITKEKDVNSFYEAAFQEAINAGSRMAAVDVGDLQSIEIDTAEDLEAARGVTAALHGEARRRGHITPGEGTPPSA
jgi:choline kinase